MSIITILTDFGTADGYVAEMKGVLCTLAPQATVVDLSHEIPPQDVDLARLAVARYWQRFPAGTTHLIVVDPGVGTRRAALAALSEGRYLVGPDNGVLSPALLLTGSRAVDLHVPVDAAPTFHGRDVFAPAAAALSRGEDLDSLGPPHAHPVIRRTPEPVRKSDGSLGGVIIAIDRFGNAVTNIVTIRGGSLVLGHRVIPVRRNYAEVEVGEFVGIVGSSGLLEIARRDGNAADALGVQRGTPVHWRAEP